MITIIIMIIIIYNERVKVKINMEKNKFTFYNSQSWEMNNISVKLFIIHQVPILLLL